MHSENVAVAAVDCNRPIDVAFSVKLAALGKGIRICNMNVIFTGFFGYALIAVHSRSGHLVCGRIIIVQITDGSKRIGVGDHIALSFLQSRQFIGRGDDLSIGF